MSRTFANRFCIILIVSGFVIFKFVIFVPTSNIDQQIITNTSRKQSIRENLNANDKYSTTMDYMHVSLIEVEFNLRNLISYYLNHFIKHNGAG